MRTPTDADYLSEFEDRLWLLRDRTKGVAQKFYTGAFFTGRPGTGKTFTVVETLEKIGADFVVKNGHVTAAGLYETFEANPDGIVVLDDVNRLFGNEIAKAILLAATSTEPIRRITYTTKNNKAVTVFTGGVIAISNLSLAESNDPVAQALVSRLQLVQHEPTDQEIGAYMRVLARRKQPGLSQTEALEVVEFLIAEVAGTCGRLDLRHMVKGWADRRQHKEGCTNTSWQNLIRSNLLQPVVLTNPISRTARIKTEVELVKSLMLTFADKKKAMAESGLSKTVFYERLKAVPVS